MMLSYQNLFIGLLLLFCCYAAYTDLRERKIKLTFIKAIMEAVITKR